MVYEKYIQHFQELEAMDRLTEHEEKFMKTGGVSFPPQSDIGFYHSVITPQNANTLITKDMRSANLSGIRSFVADRLAMFISWLSSFMKGHKMEGEKNMIELFNEATLDLSSKLNLSVSEKGWLVTNIVNPTRKFSIVPDREKKIGEKVNPQ